LFRALENLEGYCSSPTSRYVAIRDIAALIATSKSKISNFRCELETTLIPQGYDTHTAKMRGKRSKQYRKLIQQYSIHFGFREPYQVLVDADFVKDTTKCKMDLLAALERTFHGTVKPRTFLLPHSAFTAQVLTN
jgi:hypothetical protein